MRVHVCSVGYTALKMAQNRPKQCLYFVYTALSAAPCNRVFSLVRTYVHVCVLKFLSFHAVEMCISRLVWGGSGGGDKSLKWAKQCLCFVNSTVCSSLVSGVCACTYVHVCGQRSLVVLLILESECTHTHCRPLAISLVLFEFVIEHVSRISKYVDTCWTKLATSIVDYDLCQIEIS